MGQPGAVDGGGHVKKKIKLADKTANLTLLKRHLGMLNDKLKVQGDAENALTLLVKQLQGTSIKPVANPLPATSLARSARASASGGRSAPRWWCCSRVPLWRWPVPSALSGSADILARVQMLPTSILTPLIVASGAPRDIIPPDHLREVFSIETTILHAPHDSVPVCVARW